MQLFYIESHKDEIILNTEESKHAIRVLKKQKGDVLNFTDGRGNLYKAKITHADSKKCRLDVISCDEKEKTHNYYLHIAISPTKNLNRFEFFLEKATEIGIDEITPIICSRSERKVLKDERCNRILQTAIKQSLKCHKPKMNKAISFNELITKEHVGGKYIAHCEDNKKLMLKSINKINNVLILIGPEGDFSPLEIKSALQKNFKAISLSNSRLRTETAGIVSTQTINQLNL